MSETKLKQLKVVQLKDVLTKAGVAFKNNEVKSDLIAKVLANPAALKIANGDTEKPTDLPRVNDDDLLAPPEEFDWDGSSSAPATISAPAGVPKTHAVSVKTTVAPLPSPAKPVSTKNDSLPATSTDQNEPKATSITKDTQTTTASTTTTVDEELEKRKRRAERFGIPLQEPKPAKENREQRHRGKQQTKEEKQVTEDAEKLKTRAERFGTQTSPATGQKRPAVVDPEEAARRQKRAERFGTAIKTT